MDWFGSQAWQRDKDSPCLSLGPPGAFDATHIFAPCVAYEDGVYTMWYCGSRGAVAHRVFRVGRATSLDGVNFQRASGDPVLGFPDGQRSVLTPTLLRHPDGSVCREDGKLRMWFSSCDFPSGDPLHTLHQSTSMNGAEWSPPSDPQLEHAYAPTIILEDGVYRTWYTDVREEPWCFRHAESQDGCDWDVIGDAVLSVNQDWEHGRLFYPTVVKADGVYLMWYGSYAHSAGEEMKTALGFAVSEDGRTWAKAPCNPVFGPEPSNEWESHYTTSQSVLRLPDGSWRIWYASRPAPPFDHKYFAIGTARWAMVEGA